MGPREELRIAKDRVKVLEGRIQRVLDYLDRIESEPPCPPCVKWIPKDVRHKLTTDPRDEVPDGPRT